MTLDDIDLRIISFLEKDMETPYQAMANQLGVSVPTIYNRVRRLKQTGLIKKIIAQIDYEKLGYAIRALVGVSINPKAKEASLREFKKLDRVRTIYEITGRYDYLLEIIARNTEELRQLLTEQMSKIDDIQRTETMVIMRSE